MLRLKFFIFFVLAMSASWFGFSHVFSKWANRAQADAEALALQTARSVVAQLPVSPYASLVHSPALKQTLAAPSSPGTTRGMQELLKRLPELLTEAFPGWGAEDIALLIEKPSEKTHWLRGHQWRETAPEGHSKQAIQDAAHRRDVVEMGGGLKMFFLVEPPAGVESNLSLWIGGPVVRSWEASLGQELRRTFALSLGVVASGKLVMQVGQPHRPHALASLNTVVSNIQPDSAGMLKSTQTQGRGLIAMFWGTSKQLAADQSAARQNLNAGKAELVVVLSNKAAQEALLGAEQMVFYGWLTFLLMGLLMGFMAFPAQSRLASKQEKPVATAQEPAFALPSSPPPSPSVFPPSVVVSEELQFPKEASAPWAREVVSTMPSSPPSPSSFPPSVVVSEELQFPKEVSAPQAREVVSTMPSSPPSPSVFPPSVVVSEELQFPKEASAPWAREVVSTMPSSPPSPSSFPPSVVVSEELQFLEEVSAPKAGERLSKMPSSRPLSFLDSEAFKALEEASAPKAGKLPGALPNKPLVSQPQKTKAPPAPVLDFVENSDFQEEPLALGLHGKVVQPEELLGIDYAPHENPAAVFEATLREEAERFLGADFLPEHSPLSGEALSASAVEGPEMAEWRNVFAEFLRVRKQCNQDIESLSFERFKTKLEASKNNLLSKHHCKTVRFLVQIKDGKAAIKAIPVRP